MKIAICQTAALPLEKGVWSHYFKHIEKNSLVVFGEYVFDLFIQDWTSKDMIAQLSPQKLAMLESMAKAHRVKIIAPLITTDAKHRLYKQIAVIDAQSTEFYMQQRLIHYEHWDEEKFFDNPKRKTLKAPLAFEYEGIKIGVLFGFELHFDALMLKLKEQGVDLIITPTASTFQSNERWQMLCRMRAFCNGCMLVRVNSVGKVKIKDQNLEFYGESFVVNPSGQIEEKLHDKEGIACLEITKEQIHKAAREWGFREIKQEIYQ
ncbi:carbon-nitrogen hydrolase family protein [Helicobacter mustelae]|uniref:Putative carbon-nitrogen hydrolase n=1 Tax=Helicobacter mustelae (strain ATCC 43772 / CCUG 25715 / CIP 103759 / LMG 18044 / NCTC 12198 / R85-136P) TaxID=679897 RepID=D3UHX1_HELM1|nr:carbon-nitrogen hydrolase family protein [Helicobacter mustelae]CBG40094.1 Putative carbon-nitrogen hydrolase [Helicobacter mustelae 12198]SQH71608.1 carbon-nitrogen hydrolase [Helicobacter mustelae]STP12733.1 carbon-nitrogen hydrolase [Helicobacter mustelae]